MPSQLVKKIALLHQRLLNANAKTRAGMLLVLGALSATSFAPLHLVFFMLPAFTILFWLSDAAPTLRRAACVGWFFGVGHFAAGFYWVGHSFLVDAARYGWMAPFAVIGLAAGLAVFSAFVTFSTRLVCRQIPVRVYGRVLFFASIWISVEWVRGWLLTGLPWNQIGSVWGFSDSMMQFAAQGGVPGLGLLTLIAATLPAVLAVQTSEQSETQGGWLWLWPLAGFAVLIGVAAFGQMRLADATLSHVDQVRLRLVQPNIAQHLKWRSDLRMGHVRKLLALSTQTPKSGPPPTHIIWPETAVPFNLQHNKNLRSGLAAIVPQGGALLTGAPRSNAPETKTPAYWNSLLAITPDARVAAIYDKRHLVPFGEYVPWRSVLSLTKLTEGRVDFSVGVRSQSLKIDGLPVFAPLICYEAIFSDEVRALGSEPKWLLNITNDAWFGHSSGPYQHLAAVRFRAIEMGVPLVRVANTGISALIDPYGRIVDRLELGVEGVLDVDLPKPLAGQTLYQRFGDGIVALLMIVCIAIGTIGRPLSRA